MKEEPVAKLSTLKKGDCFMFNGQLYIVKNTFWKHWELFNQKIYVCRMKFEDHDWHTIGDIEVYRISRGLFDLLTLSDENENK